MHNLVPFIQFKKREKHPWKNVTFSKVAGFSPVTLLTVTLPHGCFSRFLNCTNGTELRNASHILHKAVLKTLKQTQQNFCGQCIPVFCPFTKRICRGNKIMSSILRSEGNMKRISVCDVLHYLVPFAKFKTREKHPRECYF